MAVTIVVLWLLFLYNRYKKGEDIVNYKEDEDNGNPRTKKMGIYG